MRFYLREFPDGGFEFSPVGREVDSAKLAAGFVIVDEIPQTIIDKLPGGKHFVEPEDPRDVRLRELDERLRAVEVEILKLE